MLGSGHGCLKVTDEAMCFSVHGGVDRERLVVVVVVVVDGGRAEQDTRAAAATSESGLSPGTVVHIFMIQFNHIKHKSMVLDC